MKPHESSSSVWDKYRPVRPLGTGTFGKITLAEPISTVLSEPQVAIKFVPWKFIDLSACSLERPDPALYLSLSSKNVVRLLDVCEDSGGMHFVQEFCNGGDLHQYLVGDKHKLNEKEARAFMRQICDGYNELFLHGVVHRDLKASNIFMHYETQHAVPTLKIGDLGSARDMAHASKADLRMQVAGYYLYLSPEIIRNEPLTAKTDIWLLGVLLYSMLLGLRRPFGTDMSELPKRIAAGRYTISKHHHFSKECLEFLADCLQYDPEKRADWLALRSHPFLSTDKYTPMESLKVAHQHQICEAGKWVFDIRHKVDFV